MGKSRKRKFVDSKRKQAEKPPAKMVSEDQKLNGTLPANGGTEKKIKKLGRATTLKIVASLLAIHGIMALSSSIHKSAAFDEIGHIAGGYSYWSENDYRLMAPAGNFPQRWAALPLMLGNFTFPSTEEPAWRQSAHWHIARTFLYHSDNDPAKILFCSRAMITLLSIALGLLVYGWACRLYGQLGGLLALGVYTFSPTMLAHARFATSDLSAALGFTLSAFCLTEVTRSVRIRTVLQSSLAMGLLMLSKMSGVLIIIVAVILMAVRILIAEPLPCVWRGRNYGIRARYRRFLMVCAVTAIHAIVVVAMIWAFYGFRYSTMHSAVPGTRSAAFDARKGIEATWDTRTGSAVYGRVPATARSLPIWIQFYAHPL